MNRQFIHIGYAKSGSSALQSSFFPNHPEIYFYGLFDDFSGTGNTNFSFSTESGTRICHQLRSPGFFNRFLNEDIKNLNFHIAKAKENNQTFVLSNEFFSLFDAPQWSVGQLKELFPEGKIIIIIRRQQDIIKSVYKHQGREISVAPKKYRGLYVSFNEYFDYLYENWQKKNPVHWVYSFLNKIDYYRTISYYSHEFGVENIHVLLYEDFKNNPIKFYTKLCNVMDISFDAEAEYIKMNKIVNPGTNNLQLKYFAIKSKILGNISLARSVPGGKLLAKYL